MDGGSTVGSKIKIKKYQAHYTLKKTDLTTNRATTTTKKNSIICKIADDEDIRKLKREAPCKQSMVGLR